MPTNGIAHMQFFYDYYSLRPHKSFLKWYILRKHYKDATISSTTVGILNFFVVMFGVAVDICTREYSALHLSISFHTSSFSRSVSIAVNKIQFSNSEP